MDVNISALKTGNEMKRSAGNTLSYMAGMTAAPTAEANINTNRSSVRYLIFFTPCLLALVFGSSEYTLAETFAVQAPDHAADARNNANVWLGRTRRCVISRTSPARLGKFSRASDAVWQRLIWRG